MSIGPDRVVWALERAAEAAAPFPSAALFALAAEGHASPFALLVACILSIRTRDEDTLVAARRLLARAPTPEALAALSPAAIDALIPESTYHEAKAPQLHVLAQAVVASGAVPCTAEGLTAFKGVGPKCAALVLGIACGVPAVSVDVHVHRVVNRWGLVATRRPEQTQAALEALVPKARWTDVNRILMPFGKHVCTGARPHCSACPLRGPCAQRGVRNPR